MKVGINAGHTLKGPGTGASGYITEAGETRRIAGECLKLMKQKGYQVWDCTVDQAESQQEYLEKTAALANRQELDWLVSIHFNASDHHKARGTELYTWQGRKYPEAEAVCAGIAGLGFPNRGVRDGSHLYLIRNTKARVMLIEICFCDNYEDMEAYHKAGGAAAAAEKIVMGIEGKVEAGMGTGSLQEDFMKYVGGIAVRDWEQRQILLPSVTIAQAIKESAWGTSELARNANSLFGIKKNGWTGRVYCKDAVEQLEDGDTVIKENTMWRAYGSWEESILDHSDYIASSCIGNSRKLRYASIIGCKDYRMVCHGLQDCGYATDRNYGESLIRDYIQAYRLWEYDGQ